MTTADWTAILPALCLIVAAVVVVGADLWLKGRQVMLLAVISAIGAAGALGLLLAHIRLDDGVQMAFDGALVLDHLASLLGVGVTIATLLVLFMSTTDVRRRHTGFGEYFGTLLLGAAGMLLLLGANDFITMFVSVEILSIAMYVLTGVTRRNPRSNEAAIKYLVSGAFASALLLMGMAYLYGATGSIRLDQIGQALAGGLSSPMLIVGFGLLLVGFAFKIGAAPFHMWLPDVYEGAPTSTTAFMAVAVKAAAFGALVRILMVAGAARSDLWAWPLWGMAAGTMVIGNLMAAQQTSVKRMLAFSSVAHTGYGLVALSTMRAPYGSFASEGASAALFYVFAYTFMTLGAFAFLIYLGHEVPVAGRLQPEWQDAEHLDDFAGIARRRPWAALAMTVLLVSLGGFPPTVGFVGKFWLFKSAVDQGHYALAILGVITSLVSLFYYLRVVVVMFMKDPIHTDEKTHWTVGAVVAFATAATLILGLFPDVFLGAAREATDELTGPKAVATAPAPTDATQTVALTPAP